MQQVLQQEENMGGLRLLINIIFIKLTMAY